MLFFTQKGRCYWLKVYEIPEFAKNSKGRAIQNLLNIDADDAVNAFICIKNLGDEEFVSNHYLLFATRNGVVKKTPLKDYSRPRANGVNAIIIREDDSLLQVELTDGDTQVILASKAGYATRFSESELRSMGRVSTGVRGMTLRGEEDEVVGMVTAKTNDTEHSILVVSDNGFGKRTDLDDYPVSMHRGGKGVKTLNITDKTGPLVAIKKVTDDNDLMIINQSGITLRLTVNSLRLQGRNTQGVKLIDLTKRGDRIASVCVVDSDPEEETEEIEQETSTEAGATTEVITETEENETE